MKIREFRPEDLEKIERLHTNPAYQMPQIDHPLVLIRKCVVDENDEPRMAAFGRLLIEAILFVDHSWKTPQERFEALLELQGATMEEARTRGLDIAMTQADGRFAERLAQLGWVKGYGDIYYREI